VRKKSFKTENQLLTLLLGVLFKDYIKEEEIWTELLFNGRGGAGGGA
jgi:hypothetical protein